MPFLIFVRGLHGTEAQLWADKPNPHSEYWRKANGRIVGNIVALPPEHACLPFDEIRRIYPAPALPEG